MTENNKQLEQQLWNIANTLRGKMGADDFRLDDAESDVPGDAYEYLIGKFASGAGEFYTPGNFYKHF